MAKQKPITHKELIAAVAEQQGCTHVAAKAILENVQAVIADQLEAGNAIRLPQVALFTPRLMPARKGRNPNTGETVNIPERRNIKVNLTQPMKDRLNG